MSGYSTAVKDYVERYKAEVGAEGLLDPHAIAEWAYRKGLHKPNVRTVIDAIASDIAQVFREEFRTDRHGRRYRANHATTSRRGNRTLSFWADIDDPNAPRSHFVRSFAQLRNQIVGDCLQLKTDVDVYNDKHVDQVPIQIPLDFTLDVEELQQPRRHVA